MVASPRTLRQQSGSTPHDAITVDPQLSSHQSASLALDRQRRIRDKPPILPTLEPQTSLPKTSPSAGVLAGKTIAQTASIKTHQASRRDQIPIVLAAPSLHHPPRFRALAPFGRRPHQRADSSIMPATENLHSRPRRALLSGPLPLRPESRRQVPMRNWSRWANFAWGCFQKIWRAHPTTRHVLEAVLWILNTGAQCTCCRLLAAFNCERYRTCDLAYAAILSFIGSVFSIHPVAAVAECARAIAAAALAGRRRIDHHPFAWNMVCPPELPPGSRNLRLKQVRLHSPSQLLFRNRCHR